MTSIDRVSVSHEEALVRELRADPAVAAEDLQAAMEDTDAAVLLIALRHVSETFGMAEVARETGIKRESL